MNQVGLAHIWTRCATVNLIQLLICSPGLSEERRTFQNVSLRSSLSVFDLANGRNWNLFEAFWIALIPLSGQRTFTDGKRRVYLKYHLSIGGEKNLKWLELKTKSHITGLDKFQWVFHILFTELKWHPR